MPDNTLELKIDVITKAVQEGLKNVGTGINDLCKLVENGNDLNTKSFQELAKNIDKSLGEAFKNAGKKSKKSAEDVEQDWANAFSRIQVLKSTFAGVW